MNQFFKSSVSLTIFFAAISSCLFISFSFLYTLYLDTAVYLKYLSEGAYSITISQQTGNDVFTNGNMLDFINIHNDMTIVKKQNFTSGLEIYMPSDFVCHSELKSGRVFNTSEIISGDNVVLLSADKSSDCILYDSEYRYMIDGCSFEVIGILEKNDIDSIVPLKCVLVETSDYSVGGTYYIYCNENTAALADELKNSVLTINGDANISVSKVDSGLLKNGLLPDSKIIIIVTIAVFLLMILNLHCINAYWFDGKVRECFVYKLCGLSRTFIYLRLFYNYLTLAFIGSFSGIVISSIFIFLFSLTSEMPPFSYYLVTILIDMSVSVFGIFYFLIKLQKMIRED